MVQSYSFYRYSDRVLFFSEVARFVIGRYDHVTRHNHIVISGLYKPLPQLFKGHTQADCRRVHFVGGNRAITRR